MRVVLGQRHAMRAADVVYWPAGTRRSEHNDPADPMVRGTCGPIRCKAVYDFPQNNEKLMLIVLALNTIWLVGGIMLDGRAR